MCRKMIFLSITITSILLNSNGWSSSDELQHDEVHALTTANYFLSSGKFSEYDQLREQWKNREEFPHQWLFLDAETAVLQGKRNNAIELLKEYPLIGKEETNRLVRLAALHVIENPEQTWSYLAEASLKDPHNADLHTFKASLLESHHKVEEAEKEYLIAVKKQPNDPYLKEQLGDFYLREAQYIKALEMFSHAMKESPSIGSVWIKAIFWTHVTAKMALPTGSVIIPSDSLQPLVSYLHSLPAETFWDAQKFDDLPGKDHFLSTYQELFWLRLLGALKDNDEALARQILEQDSFKSLSWAPELEISLKALLDYRFAAGNSFVDVNISEKASQIDIETNLSDEEKFLALLSFSIPSELREQLLAPEAVALPFLAFGWNEAALQLHTPSKISSQSPEWVICCFTEALAANRGKEAAIAFAVNHPPFPRKTLSVARLMLSSGDKQGAFELLNLIYQDKNSVSSEATLLITPIFLANNDPKAAKAAILNQPSLVDKIEARELLARAFFLDGDGETAYRLYLSLEPHSSEAKSFLARKAFSDGDWQRARQLTKELLEIYPNSIALKENLKSISR